MYAKGGGLAGVDHLLAHRSHRHTIAGRLSDTQCAAPGDPEKGVL